MKKIYGIAAILISLLLGVVGIGVSPERILEVFGSGTQQATETVSPGTESSAKEIFGSAGYGGSSDGVSGSDRAKGSGTAGYGGSSDDVSGSGQTKGFGSKGKTDRSISEDGAYSKKEDVALYIHTYDRLPRNFITKNEARKLGWEGGSLEPFAPGKCIGGDHFGNYEELLPESAGRSYYECDIDTLRANSRGAKRIVFSNDGLIFYTGDHYKHFDRLY